MSIENALQRRDLVAAIGRGAVSGIIARIIQITTRMVTVPIVISHLGVEGYGIWSIIMTTATYMRFGSIGVKCAFQKYVAEATGNGNYLHTSRLLSTGCALMLVLSATGLAPIALCSAGLARVAGVPSGFLPAASTSISILAAIMLISNAGAIYEAVVMGGHRIDIARNFSTFFTFAEAIAIIILLHRGHGLIAMAAVMGLSEIGFVTCCWIAARRIIPQVRVSFKLATKDAINELMRFAGSYQLASVMEILYLSIVPFVILRETGAYYSGLYALAYRLVSANQMLPEAFVLPILSGAAMVFASGAEDTAKTLVNKSFKITLGVSFLPMIFLSIFGTKIVHAWTGQADSSLRMVLLLVGTATFANAFSILGLVLYRASGRTLLDNIRQVLRIGMLLTTTVIARRWGLYGVLGGLAASELGGAVFMLVALAKTLPAFRLRPLIPDAIRIALASCLVILSGLMAEQIPLPITAYSARLQAGIQLAMAFAGCAVALVPAIWITKAINAKEISALMSTVTLARTRGYPEWVD